MLIHSTFFTSSFLRRNKFAGDEKAKLRTILSVRPSFRETKLTTKTEDCTRFVYAELTAKLQHTKRRRNCFFFLKVETFFFFKFNFKTLLPAAQTGRTMFQKDHYGIEPLRD